MISREDIMAARDDILARREELARHADEIRERFAESIDQDFLTDVAGWTLVSGGIALGVTQWARGRRGFVALLLPMGLLAAGASILGGGFMHRRGIRIDETEVLVREQLAGLDPVARFHILRDVGRESMPFIRHSHN